MKGSGPSGGVGDFRCLVTERLLVKLRRAHGSSFSAFQLADMLEAAYDEVRSEYRAAAAPVAGQQK